MVKSKSMLTEECHLNEYLAEKGIDVIDSDLGERIVQLRKEPPSHIVLPAIHLRKTGCERNISRTSGYRKRQQRSTIFNRGRTNAPQGHFLDQKSGFDLASILPSPKREKSWFAPMKEMPTWAYTSPTCILPVWVSKKLFHNANTWAFS